MGNAISSEIFVDANRCVAEKIHKAPLRGVSAASCHLIESLHPIFKAVFPTPRLVWLILRLYFHDALRFFEGKLKKRHHKQLESEIQLNYNDSPADSLIDLRRKMFAAANRLRESGELRFHLEYRSAECASANLTRINFMGKWSTGSAQNKRQQM